MIRRAKRFLRVAWVRYNTHCFSFAKAAAAAAAAASSIPAVSSGADIDTDEFVDETGVEPKDIELIMSQVRQNLKCNQVHFFLDWLCLHGKGPPLFSISKEEGGKVLL